jgi:hypothetical protein
MFNPILDLDAGIRRHDELSPQREVQLAGYSMHKTAKNKPVAPTARLTISASLA